MVNKHSITTQTAAPTAPEDMVWVEGGIFLMGDDRFYPEEAPVTQVIVPAFRIDPTAVTNAQFTAFVNATGYVTLAERAPEPALYPDADPTELVSGSLVFTPPDSHVDLRIQNWWSYVPGANWRHPEGPDSDIKNRTNHPVVHVAYEDAVAYADWVNKILPNEAEWEYAALGGATTTFSWGDEITKEGRFMANTWYGDFPSRNLKPARPGTEPVASYPANGFGLYDMLGNVWEWTSDTYWDHLTPSKDSSIDGDCCADATARAGTDARKSVKGGSFLCAENYCFRYRPAARQPQTIDTSTCHIGFRCIIRG